MENLVKCAKCGKKPRVKPKESRGDWKADGPARAGGGVSHVQDDDKVFAGGLRPSQNDAKKAKSVSSSPTAKKKSTKQPSIFDKLTDTSKYTGTHKQRFDDDGKGRGLEGRDSVAKGSGHIPSAYRGGDVNDLSQITRNDAPKSTAPKKKAASSGGKQPSIFDKLTDPTLYTGSHKGKPA